MEGNVKAIAPHGFVKLVRVDGDDDFIALSARHGKESDNPTPKLIRYMMRHRHTTPFETVGLVFHLKMPIFVARQWMRHRMGTFNELSGRYEEMKPEYWMPKAWSEQAEGNHQGRSSNVAPVEVHGDAEEGAFSEYRRRIAGGVAREQARSCLPLSTYTEMFWKVDIHNLFHFLKLRLDPHAQAEIREFAQAVEGFVKASFPIAHAAWADCVRDAVTLTVQDQLALGEFFAGRQSSPNNWPSTREAGEFGDKMVKIAIRSSIRNAMEQIVAVKKGE